MSKSAAVDWRAYYDREGETKQFLPESDAAEAMRVSFVNQMLGDLTLESALDAGCGNGYLASTYLARGATKVAGIDFSRPRLADARSRFPDLRLSRASATRLPFAPKSFDLVSLVEVLEHLPKAEEALRELARVARRHILVTVPYRGKVIELVCPHCMKEFHYDGHIHSFNEENLPALAESAGLNVERVEAFIPYHPPRSAFLRRFPGVHRSLRGLAVATRFRAPQPPKYLGLLARP